MICTWRPEPGVTLAGFPCPECLHAIWFHEGTRACLACRLEYFLDTESVPG